MMVQEFGKTSKVWITDKSGEVMFSNMVGVGYEAPAIRDLQRHLDNAKKYPAHYKFLDLETARIVVNGV